MSVPDLPSLARNRARARLLLSHLRGNDPTRARAAAERMLRLRSFAAATADELLAEPTRVRLKHALTVVAVEQGFASWVALKAASLAAAPSDRSLAADALYVPRMGVYLNRWFADYDEARAALAQEGGYLLPYRQYFFLTVAGAVRELGLDPDDPDWRAIGFDWVRPADAAAHARLVERRMATLAR